MSIAHAMPESGAPASDVDPFSIEFFEDPHRIHDELRVRQNGRAVHAMHLFEVKKLEESRYPFDYYNAVHTIPGEQAFRPMAEGGCPLVR